MMADAMATALMVMGGKTGARFAREQGISALFLLRGTDGCRPVGTGVFAVDR
jgi:thiamine biosynthesis lipoprotein